LWLIPLETITADDAQLCIDAFLHYLAALAGEAATAAPRVRQ